MTVRRTYRPCVKRSRQRAVEMLFSVSMAYCNASISASGRPFCTSTFRLRRFRFFRASSALPCCTSQRGDSTVNGNRTRSMPAGIIWTPEVSQCCLEGTNR